MYQLVFLILAAIVGALVARRVGRCWLLRRLARRFERARRLEVEAERLLLRKGFRMQGRKVARTATLLVDGRELSYELELDYLVLDLRDRPFVAEVKSGETAPDPLHAPTRRQLLDYAVAFPETAGLLLVDMEANVVHEVESPTLRRAI
jgi:hypothetical protein